MASLIQTVGAAYGIIVSNEGSYTSVNRDDNGALSIGALQWHGERARELLLKLTEKIPKAYELLGEMYVQLKDGTDWSERVLDSEEAERIRALLTYDEAKKIQDELAKRDIREDMEKGISYGITQCGALIYFADGANQYGRYSELWKNACMIAKKSGGTLESLHSAVLSLTEQKRQRRMNTYEKVKRLDICNEYLDGEKEDVEIYTVVSGDTLGKIARRYGVDVDSILRANEKRYPKMTKNYIECDWTLEIPKQKSARASMLEYLAKCKILDSDSEEEYDIESVLLAIYRITKRVEEVEGRE